MSTALALIHISPLLGYDTEVLKLDFPSKLTSFLDRGETDESDSGADSDEDSGGDDAEESDDENADDADKTASGEGTAESDSGYALQFGLFTTKDRAQELVDDLDADGVDAQIREIDGKYKVISPLVDTKDEAVELSLIHI